MPYRGDSAVVAAARAVAFSSFSRWLMCALQMAYLSCGEQPVCYTLCLSKGLGGCGMKLLPCARVLEKGACRLSC